MTLQQLEYVLAVEEYRHFVRAAESCGITQSTLSSMIHKLEEELDILIFDRNAHPIEPTTSGQEIIKQARIVLFHANQLKEMSLTERKRVSGHIQLGITPTIGPYIIPKLFKFINDIPDVTMNACELDPMQIIAKLKTAEINMAIMSQIVDDPTILEIPLFQEKFYAYVSEHDPLFKEEAIQSEDIPAERLWSLSNEICLRKEICNLVAKESTRQSNYQTGSVPTLLHIVNQNDGLTVIPELHIPMIREEDRFRIRPIVNPEPIRQVSLFVRSDFVREGLLNLIADGIKKIIPSEMIEPRLCKFQIHL